MYKNILIISSNFTGNGHKSITESLCEYFYQVDSVNIHVIDGFSLGGNTLLSIGKSYVPITRISKNLWEFIWKISFKKPALVNKIVEMPIKNNLLRLLKSKKIDLILTVHPNFNGSIIDLLKKNNINIPVITLIADLVSIYPLWADYRAQYVIAPTEEAKEKCMEFGVPKSKIKVLGFPVRSKFTCNKKDKINCYDLNKPLNCLIMSGSEGSGNMGKIAKILLDNFNCNVKIVTGNNVGLKRKLEGSLKTKYKDRIEIYGFTNKINELMLSSDVAFTRASPNVIMEAVYCNLPIIVTDGLGGQEEGNPKFVEKHNLGIAYNNISDIKKIVNILLKNNAEKLNEIKFSQRKYIKSNASKDIADFIVNINEKCNE